MKMTTIKVFCGALVALLLGTSTVWAAKRRKAPAKVATPLTETGKALQKQYTAQIASLKAELEKAVPAVDPQKKATYLKAIETEKSAKAALDAAKKNLGAVGRGHALVGHAKGKWIGGADKGIASTRAKLKNAKTDAERKALQEQLVKWQKNREDGVKALKERQKILDEALAKEPELKKAEAAARKALENAKVDVQNALKAMGLHQFIASDALDGTLAKYVVMVTATPRGLAEFAQKGDAQKTLLDTLLADATLLRQMAVADGAKDGKCGDAMEIYTAIQKASGKAKSGVLQRLALAISLELATPLSQRNPTGATNAPTHVDPVGRYLQFEKAFLDGELDPSFKTQSVWDLRMVVDGNEPDETLVWGRKMLRNYRPDHITTPDYRWRYVAAVRTDVRYGSQDNKYDKPDLQFFQNILMNGGVCGRRAFFGRFILRAFGIPTTARPQRGHAALAHWTPKGWVVCLGGGWGSGWTKTRYDRDLDFLANTQARNNQEAYLEVKRAQWVGMLKGEKPVYGMLSGNPGFWFGLSLIRQREIIAEAKAVALAAVGTDIGEANESKVKEKVKAVTISEEDRKIVVAKNGVITIPAAACSKPKNSTGKIKFMKSNLGGMQLHYSRNGGPEPFEYTFDAPAAGKYLLTARVVTPSWKQRLTVATNNAKTSVDVELPFTVGMWDTTPPVEITLVKGKNVLTFSRDHPGLKGSTFRDFTLTPKK